MSKPFFISRNRVFIFLILTFMLPLFVRAGTVPWMSSGNDMEECHRSSPHDSCEPTPCKHGMGIETPNGDCGLKKEPTENNQANPEKQYTPINNSAGSDQVLVPRDFNQELNNYKSTTLPGLDTSAYQNPAQGEQIAPSDPNNAFRQLDQLGNNLDTPEKQYTVPGNSVRQDLSQLPGPMDPTQQLNNYKSQIFPGLDASAHENPAPQTSFDSPRNTDSTFPAAQSGNTSPNQPSAPQSTWGDFFSRIGNSFKSLFGF